MKGKKGDYRTQLSYKSFPDLVNSLTLSQELQVFRNLGFKKIDEASCLRDEHHEWEDEGSLSKFKSLTLKETSSVRE